MCSTMGALLPPEGGEVFDSALARQVGEAVRIAEWGEEVVLNSKSEFNRCQLGRLTTGDEKKVPSRMVEDEKEKEEQELEEQSK